MTKFDIVIVGDGIAGLTAANRAAELGLSACVLEKGRNEKYLCNTGGTLHVCMNDIMSGEEVLRGVIEVLCGDITRPDLADAMARDALYAD